MKKPMINIIVQARMSSTRLKGKVLLPVCGKPLLVHVIERIQRVKHKHRLIVATTTDSQDDLIQDIVLKHHVRLFRGDAFNVLKRYKDCCNDYPADVIVRITSDCPLIDPAIIDKALSVYLEGNFDYVSNTQNRSYPRGMDVEVFSYKSLEYACQHAENEFDKEHVTAYIYNHPQKFNLKSFSAPLDHSFYRLTVDTKEDFQLINTIYEYLYPINASFGLQDILDALKKHPDWAFINQHVRQKNS